jgi:hypothetical protein
MVNHYCVLVHATQSPSDREWELVLAFFRDAEDLNTMKVLVYTDGAAPNAKQRARLNAIVGSNRPRMAVLTPSAFARTIGTAISWFHPGFRVFGPNDLDSAFNHLGAPPPDQVLLRVALNELRTELSARVLRSAAS